MRILGVILFVMGFFLLFTIFLAPLGLFFMFLGVLLMAFGRSRRKVVINNVVSVNAPMPAQVPYEAAPVYPAVDRVRREPVLQPATQFALPSPEPRMRTLNPDQYDKEKWRALVEYDPDIGRVVSALAPYGQKYVDQLAKAYLALNDKEYLPMIVKKILATAREDSVRRD